MMQVDDVFGRLIVVELIPGIHARRSPRARVRCTCGNEVVVLRFDLASGHTQSCGCLRREQLATRNSEMSGQAHPRWRGDAVGYTAMHRRVERVRGLAGQHVCTCGCGRRAQDWAYDHLDPNELQSEDGPYSLDVTHYRPMRTSCHKIFDVAHSREAVA